MSNNDYEGLAEMQRLCDFEVSCIYCGKLVMYADPTHHIGQQLPDMICIPCKKQEIK